MDITTYVIEDDQVLFVEHRLARARNPRLCHQAARVRRRRLEPAALPWPGRDRGVESQERGEEGGQRAERAKKKAEEEAVKKAEEKLKKKKKKKKKTASKDEV